MPRKGPIRKKDMKADLIYGSFLLEKLINRSMKDGKKSVVQKQVYNALKIIAEKTKKEPITVFDQAIENIKPEMEVRSRRVGGAAYQVPMAVRGERRESLAIRWLVASTRARSNSEYHTYAEKLAAEIIDAANGEGGAVKKRQEIEKIAESNKAFSHFRW